MKKKIVSVLLAIALMASLCTGAALGYAEEYEGYAPAVEQKYSDVPEKHWAFESVNTCSQRDWFNGYPDGTFKPANQIRRDEAAKVFAVALGLTIEKDPAITYTDTGSNWAKGYIEATKNLFPNTTTLAGTSAFRPEQTITREETVYALVVAWRYASETANADLSVLNMFSDKNSISEAIKPYVAVAASEELMSGIPDGKGGSTIQGQAGLSRAEFATLLARALKHGIGPDDTTPPAIKLDNYSTVTPDDTVEIAGTVGGYCEAFTCNGKSISVDKNGAFMTTVPLAEGANSFTLEATKKWYGSRSTATIAITRNSTKPSIRLLSTIPGETTQSSVSANGKINAWSDDCTLLLDNSRVQVDSEGLFEMKLTLKEGVNSFKLEVVQKGSSVSSQTITITRLTTTGAGEWLEKLPDGVTSANYNVEEKTQYRTQTREVKTSAEDAMAGWTLVTKGGNWGDWSSWQSTPVTASNTRKIETQSVKTADGRTQYRYYAYSGYLTSAGSKLSGVTAGAGQLWRHFSTKWMDSYTTSYSTDYTPWLDSAITRDSSWHQVYAGQDGYKYRHNGVVYYHEETRTTDPVYETQYRYQEYSGSNVFEKWSDWSSWSDTAAKEETNTKVETRTMYRFTVK